jgi:hypothetical protein
MKRWNWIGMFFAALTVRVLYAIAAPAIYFNVDTSGYYGLGVNLFAHPSLQTLITPYRTPVYPIFLNAIMYIAGVGGSTFGSPTFLTGVAVVVAIQMLIGAIAFTAFCLVLTRLIPNRTRLLFSTFLLFDVFVIGWEHTLMTEGLAISVSLAITTVLFHMLLGPTRKKFMLLWLLFAFGFLLRPSFIVYPIATLPLVAWYFRKRARTVFLACITLAAAAIVPLAYAGINYAQTGYFGIQFVSDIDVLGRILGFTIPVASAKQYTYFYTTVIDSRKKDVVIPTGFQFLDQYDPSIYGKVYRFVELQAFNKTVILHNIPLYVTKAMGTIPEILLEVCDFTRVPASSPFIPTSVVWVLQQLYGLVQYATLAVPFLWIVTGSIFLIKPSRWNTLIALIGTIAMSQIVLMALMVYKDVGGQYGREISVIRPQMFLYLFLCGISALKWFHEVPLLPGNVKHPLVKEKRQDNKHRVES